MGQTVSIHGVNWWSQIIGEKIGESKKGGASKLEIPNFFVNVFMRNFGGSPAVGKNQGPAMQLYTVCVQQNQQENRKWLYSYKMVVVTKQPKYLSDWTNKSYLQQWISIVGFKQQRIFKQSKMDLPT